MRTLANLWPALVGMALVTYATRAGGLFIVGAVRNTARLSRVLQHLATGVLTALVVSGIHEGDAAIAAAALAAMAVMRTTGHFLVALGGAALTAAAVRAMV